MAERTVTQRREIEVEVVYALPDLQRVVRLSLPEGSTVAQAIEVSGLLEDLPALDPVNAAIGIFGRLVPLSRQLSGGDRVEIYRPLMTDPKQTRRERAKQASKKR